MSPEALRLEEVVGRAPDSEIEEAEAEDLGSEFVLRFRIEADAESLEALSHVRRAMLREEWTRGLDPGEPSLEGAVFSTSQIRWAVGPSQKDRCLEKLAALVERARLARAGLAPLSASARRSTRAVRGE
jgi:hypothetical protein